MQNKRTKTSKSALVVFNYTTCSKVIHALATQLLKAQIAFTVHNVKCARTKITCTALRFACSKQAYMFTCKYAELLKAYVNNNKQVTCLLAAHNAVTCKMLLTTA
jgi:hypothetical protein